LERSVRIGSVDEPVEEEEVSPCFSELISHTRLGTDLIHDGGGDAFDGWILRIVVRINDPILGTVDEFDFFQREHVLEVQANEIWIFLRPDAKGCSTCDVRRIARSLTWIAVAAATSSGGPHLIGQTDGSIDDEGQQSTEPVDQLFLYG
jgi:hypothetical protein